MQQVSVTRTNSYREGVEGQDRNPSPEFMAQLVLPAPLDTKGAPLRCLTGLEDGEKKDELHVVVDDCYASHQPSLYFKRVIMIENIDSEHVLKSIPKELKESHSHVCVFLFI